ncbi:cystathionine gamma-synthase [Georgenia sp. Z1344]|uniref:cystathionine gamma-synthase n=1 Tax=Georgenia sp. Z1344 TaxID=3416706 RepID=UPI003CFA04CD
MTQPSTRTIHAGQSPDEATGAVSRPLHLSSTFRHDSVGVLRAGFEYTRTGNPTRSALQDTLAELEGGRSALTFASGMAAEDAVLRALTGPGAHVLLGDDAYAGTHRLLESTYGAWGVTLATVDLTDVDAVRASVTAQAPTVVWVETPSNPLLRIVDVAAVAEIAHAVGAVVVVDNTFATPYLQQPITLGADLVLHSLTKYLGGHSDVVGGAVVLADDRWRESLADLQNDTGTGLAPFDSWLVSRGIKTLAVRMDRHCTNAARVADALTAHDLVTEVAYPGLATHPGHDVAARQMSGFGGMVSVRLRDAETARTFVESTELFTLAESLGGVESLIEHPATMTHLAAVGTPLQVPDDLVRISVGIEDAGDLVDDLHAALDLARSATGTRVTGRA